MWYFENKRHQHHKLNDISDCKDDGYFCTLSVNIFSINQTLNCNESINNWILTSLKYTFLYSAIMYLLHCFEQSIQKIVLNYLDTQSYCCVPESMFWWLWTGLGLKRLTRTKTWRSCTIYFISWHGGRPRAPQMSHKLNMKQTAEAARLYTKKGIVLGGTNLGKYASVKV